MIGFVVTSQVNAMSSCELAVAYSKMDEQQAISLYESNYDFRRYIHIWPGRSAISWIRNCGVDKSTAQDLEDWYGRPEAKERANRISAYVKEQKHLQEQAEINNAKEQKAQRKREKRINTLKSLFAASISSLEKYTEELAGVENEIADLEKAYTQNKTDFERYVSFIDSKCEAKEIIEGMDFMQGDYQASVQDLNLALCYSDIHIDLSKKFFGGLELAVRNEKNVDPIYKGWWFELGENDGVWMVKDFNAPGSKGIMSDTMQFAQILKPGQISRTEEEKFYKDQGAFAFSLLINYLKQHTTVYQKKRDSFQYIPKNISHLEHKGEKTRELLDHISESIESYSAEALEINDPELIEYISHFL
jgi:hypothetical protein